MKLKPMVLTELGDETIAVPVEETAEVFQGVIRLNATALDIWHGIEDGKTTAEIAAELVEKYDGVDLPKATECVNAAISQLKSAGVLED